MLSATRAPEELNWIHSALRLNTDDSGRGAPHSWATSQHMPGRRSPPLNGIDLCPSGE